MMSILEHLGDLFGATRYLAHSICLTNDPVIIPIFILSDGGIGIAYYVIAGTLYFCYLNKARVIRLVLVILNDRTFLKLFFFFIMCCGITHHTMLLTLWFGVYYLDAFARFVTLVASVGTAIRVVYAIWRSNRTSQDLDRISGETAAPYLENPVTLPNVTIENPKIRGK